MPPQLRRRFALAAAFIAATSGAVSSKPNPNQNTPAAAFVVHPHSPTKAFHRPRPATVLDLQPTCNQCAADGMDPNNRKQSPTKLDLYVEDQMTATAASTSSSTVVEDYVKARGGNLPIKKILIANNGMAATKSILSMRQWAYLELGDEHALEFVAMATPEDIKANAEFVRLADSFVEVPGGKNLNNYANVDVISKVAQEQDVDAVWPGWGHASENPKLPEALSAMGIKFIGPTSPVMSVLGDKIAANILAQTAGMPCVPWSGTWGGENDGPLEAKLTDEGRIPDETFQKGNCHSVEEALETARKIGYENGIMIKASEGGGGKGIRLVYNEEDLPNAFLQVQNEVVGSPIFLMQLCKNNRHIEIQIVGDEHGNAVAFSGRDCSTQRRFQKIFEEAPPAIVPPETFREMEKAAQRLTQTIGYRGAGTVEFLYNADENKYYFLELNPRLQVEHPVTEGISNVNLPATQLQCAMGIPLYKIPEVRRFYGKEDIYGDDVIDFLEEDYAPINTHVIAARITAENPDEGFKPTAGSIERVKFQSKSDVWGYFCVGPNGGIHEYADSQFGHVFAKAPTREAARKALILALKDVEVKGEIRTTVEYLQQLLGTPEFKSNSVTTSWLDGILKEKSMKVERPPHLVVTSAAIYQAFQHVKAETKSIVDSFERGQVVTTEIPSISSFDIEIPFENVKYPFHVEVTGPNAYQLSLGSNLVDVELTETADGALIAKYGGETHRIQGRDEALGLRLVLDGATILMPDILDPTELRTDVTGKIVRYLHENGAEVEAGEPYVEVEAMKMIMTMKAQESGKITHALSPGTVIGAGDLLATMELKDASKVDAVETFDGTLDISSDTVEVDAKAAIGNILAGYKGDVEAATRDVIAQADDVDDASSIVADAVNEFLRVESLFANKAVNDAVRELTKANADKLDVVISDIRAHQALPQRVKLISAMLRQVGLFSDRFGSQEIPDNLLSSLQDLSQMEGKDYGEVALAAETIVRQSKIPPFEERVESLRTQLLRKDVDLVEMAESPELSAGVDMLTYLFSDEDDTVKAAAIEVYVRRAYRAHRIIDLSVEEINKRLTCTWSFQFKETPSGDTIVRHGLLSVLPNLDHMEKDLPSILSEFGTQFTNEGKAVNELYIASAACNNDIDVETVEPIIVGQERELTMLGIRSTNILLPITKKDPAYHCFPQSNGYQEDPLRRNMRPTCQHMLELERLGENFELERIPAVANNVRLYLGAEKTDKPTRGGPQQVVFLRSVSKKKGLNTLAGAERSLVHGLDELERAQANSKVKAEASSRIFYHSLEELAGVTPEEAAAKFGEIMDTLKSKFADRLLKLNVDEIETKIRIATTDADGNPIIVPVRLVASSMEGEWLKTTAYVEHPDPLTGLTRQYCVVDDGGEKMCILDPYETSNVIQTKRSIARRVGSTYAYDFLGLLEVGLLGQWQAYTKSLGYSDDNLSAVLPAGFFSSQELVENENGELVPGTRPIGTNKVGMVAWRVTIKTPEYPEGRDVVFIANDVTVKSGSFGVQEDEMYYKASKYARENGLPRVYIACNAGARIGLYEDLKDKIKVKYYDENIPTKGYEYIYLSDEEYKALPEGAVNAHKVDEGWALDDIIGTEHGIGVENLQGSGKIAGETSQAYDDVFTLSYVTGRSVGIGAYLVRLGQRIIQMKQGPILLTGYAALNKLLGREVYTTNDQLGGLEIMVPNGVTHLEVENDQEGVDAMLDWLSYVPSEVGVAPASRKSSDPIDRDVKWRPTLSPYDPRLMLSGTDDAAGFFDVGSFKEYLAGWGKTVIVGRGRLGGIPMGAIAVETRNVEQVVPADPANPDSTENRNPQAGNVFYPDSSFKTAQTIRDMDKEGLPLMIFANWRGFSGGSRDMSGEVLKFGSHIVDALREYSNPVYIYIPPHGELRGGSWVVLDPTINLEQMEMYADPDSRGGILEPAGIAEIKFRAKDQLKVMHKNDRQLQLLDAELENTDEADTETREAISKQIAAREELLKPVFLQAATEFCDLHDRAGRMKAKGVIKEAVPWARSREYFYYRAQRRIIEDGYVKQLRQADASIDRSSALSILKDVLGDVEFDDNKAAIEAYESNKASIEKEIRRARKAAIEAKINLLQAELEETLE